MSTELNELWALLRAPFDIGELHGREQGGTKLWYIDARAVMDRLDDLLPGAWEDTYRPVTLPIRIPIDEKGKQVGPSRASTWIEKSVGGMVCDLTLHLPSGRTITRSGVAQVTDIEDLKGAESDALKRAGVKFGIARYLYYLDAPKSARDFPAWARPGGSGRPPGGGLAAARPDEPERAAAPQPDVAADELAARAATPPVAQQRPAEQKPPTATPPPSSPVADAYRNNAKFPIIALCIDAIVGGCPVPQGMDLAILETRITKGPETWLPKHEREKPEVDQAEPVIVNGRMIGDAIFDPRLRQWMHIWSKAEDQTPATRRTREALTEWISELSKSDLLTTF
jgi:hypothetical protein